jgi:ADP-heptose:LPS heptosyltransferase
MHLAASQGTRCVALFGTYNIPRRWFPFGREHDVIYEPLGIRHIGVERVAGAIEAAILSRNGMVSAQQLAAS